MAFGKRQLILAALVVALGAAVYLNWQFTGDNTALTATSALNSEKSIGEAQLVNASASSSSSFSEESSGSVSQAAASSSATSEGWFADAKLSRQKARDEAVELLEKVLKDAGESDEAKKEAVSRAAVIADNVLKENNIESLIRAKGFGDCIVFIQNEECSIVIKGGESVENSAVLIKDIVMGQAGISYDKIKIIENKE